MNDTHDLTALIEALQKRIDHAVEVGDGVLPILWVGVSCDVSEYPFPRQP